MQGEEKTILQLLGDIMERSCYATNALSLT